MIKSKLTRLRARTSPRPPEARDDAAPSRPVRRRGPARLVAALVAAAAAACGVAGAPANAATVGTDTAEDGATIVFYAADPGVIDDIAISRPTTGGGWNHSRVQIHSPYHPLRIAGSECTTSGDPGSTNVVSCPQKSALVLLLEDADDKIQVGAEIGALPVVTLAGAGNDRLAGGPGADILLGEDGNDVLASSPGANHLDGGGGDDLLLSGPANEQLDGGPGDDTIEEGANGGGADDMRGGDGIDRLLFDEHGPVAVSLDDNPDDGSAGEGDNARSDIENVDVDAGGSTVIGSEAANVLRSAGRGARTVLDGRGGNDRLIGDVGPEQLLGGVGDDELLAGLGDDELDGGAGRDSFAGDGGADTLLARDGVAETLSCGSGADRAVVDHDDLVAAGDADTCEAVDRRADAAPQGQTPTAARPAALSLRAKSKRTRGRYALRIDATATGLRDCAGRPVTVKIVRGRRLVAKRSLRLNKGCSARTTVRVKRRGRYTATVQVAGLRRTIAVRAGANRRRGT